MVDQQEHKDMDRFQNALKLRLDKFRDKDGWSNELYDFLMRGAGKNLDRYREIMRTELNEVFDVDKATFEELRLEMETCLLDTANYCMMLYANMTRWQEE